MYLTKEEERILNGEQGSLLQKAMEIMVRFGDAMRAERLVPIVYAHVSLTSTNIRGEHEFLKSFVTEDAKVKVPTTCQTLSIDRERWTELGISEDVVKMAMEIVEIFKRLGIKLTFTCTPYYLIEGLVKLGDHIASCESSAVTYFNSVIGARTNRESGQSGLISALIGKTPEYGYHLTENRKGTVLVKVEARLIDDADFSSLGFQVGKVVGPAVPVFDGIKKPTIDQLKILANSLALMGGISLYHVVGVTPEAKTIKDAFQGDVPEDKITITNEDIERTYKELTTGPGEVRTIIIGCPHLSLDELKRYATLLEGKKVKEGVKVWFFTSAGVFEIAKRIGIIDKIEATGARVYRDTCPLLMDGLKKKPEMIATNAVKQSYYGQSFIPGTGFYFGRTDKVIKAAFTGRWE